MVVLYCFKFPISGSFAAKILFLIETFLTVMQPKNWDTILFKVVKEMKSFWLLILNLPCSYIFSNQSNP